MKKINLKLCILLLAVSVNSLIHAQANKTRYAFSGGNVYAIVNATDGSTYVGGDFTTVNLYSGNGVIIDTGNGVWDYKDATVIGAILCVVSIPSTMGGGWYIGGEFTSINGQPRNRLARINADGSLHSFDPNMDNRVFSLALDASGNLYVGGWFSTIGGSTTRSYIAKFDNTGALTSFDPNLNGHVYALAFDTIGNLYVGGSFRTVGGKSHNRLAKFDTAGVFMSFNPNMNGIVRTLVFDESGNLYAGGEFTTVGAITRNRIAKFDNTGVLTSFNPNMDNKVNTLAIDASGNLYAGGAFSTVGGSTTRNRIAKFDNTGALMSFDPNMNNEVNAIVLDSTGNLYAGGFFTTVGGTTTRNYLAKFNNVGNLTNFNPNMGNNVFALACNMSGDLYVGGQFTTIGESITRNSLVKFDNAGILTSFNPNINGSVRSIVLDTIGNLYVGGDFTSVGGTITRNRLAKFDKVGDLTNFDPNIGNTVLTLALDASGNLYVGGSFTTVGGSTTRNRIAKYDNTGVLTNFNPSMNNTVLALVLDASENLYVGGDFSSVGGSTTRNRIAKFDNSGVLTNFDPDLNIRVSAIAFDSSGNLYVGGAFTTVGGSITRRYLAKFDNSGALTSFDPNMNNGVSVLAIDARGNLFAGGSFTSVGGSTTRNRIAKFDSTGVLTSFSPNLSNGVFALAIDASGNLFAGGWFAPKFAYFCIPPTVSYSTPEAICGAGTITLNATASSGATIKWYADSIGGNPIHIGSTFTTQSIATTTVFYAEADNGECVSVKRTPIVATINNSTTGTDVQTACDSYTWIDGITYLESTDSATFKIVGGAANGCDSIVTLDLIINNPITGTDMQIACDSFTWIDGNTYTTNNYTATFNIVGGAANGCDSLVTLDLIINNSVTGVDVQTACNSFTWIDGNTYTTSNNTATFNIIGGASSAFGCDSLVTLNLTINTVDISVTDNSPTIISNAMGATYQWLDCTNGNIPISGETNQSFTATVNGDYAVEVTQNSCTDTSLCVTVNNVGIKEIQPNIYNLSIYPNPSHGLFTLEYNFDKPVQIEVLTIHGKLILKRELTENSNVINLSDQPSGMYFINVSFGDSQKITRKIIVN